MFDLTGLVSSVSCGSGVSVLGEVECSCAVDFPVT